MLSQVHQNVAYRIVIGAFEFTVFPLNRRVIFYLKVGNLYVISQNYRKFNELSFFFWMQAGLASQCNCNVLLPVYLPVPRYIQICNAESEFDTLLLFHYRLVQENTHNEVFINFTSRNWHHIRWGHFWRKIRLRYVLTYFNVLKKQFGIFGFNKNVSSHFTLHWYLIRTGFGCLVPNYTDAHTHMRKQ